jgi:hypothetical protein
MRSGSSTARVILITALAAIMFMGAMPVIQQPAGAQSGAVTPMLPSDRIVRPTRGSVAITTSFARHYGAVRLTDVGAYVSEVYRLAPQVGIDPAIVVAQSALETDTWRTSYWQNHLNPAGIGITYNGQSSYTWTTGTDAARGHLVHLYLYAVGEIPSGHILAPYKHLDPRYQAAVDAGYAGVARTISDLTGRWATDPIYGEKLASRGNDQLVRHRISAAYQTSNSASAWLADDANPYTSWQSATTYPSLAIAMYDLGAVRSLGLVRWLLHESGYADLMRVQFSNDGVSWWTAVSAGNGPALQWQGLMVNTSARYVRFVFSNPNRDPKLGSLAEVQFWPPTTAPLSFVTWRAPSPVTTSTPVASPTATPFATATSAPAPPTATSASRTIRGDGGSETSPPTATAVAPAPNTPAATSPSAPTATPASRSIRR